MSNGNAGIFTGVFNQRCEVGEVGYRRDTRCTRCDA